MDILVFIFKELDTYNMGIFNNLHSYLNRNCLFYYDSLDSYLTNKEPVIDPKVTLLYKPIVGSGVHNQIRTFDH